MCVRVNSSSPVRGGSHIARGVSPWITVIGMVKPRRGDTLSYKMFRPDRAAISFLLNQGLTPLAINCRPCRG